MLNTDAHNPHIKNKMTLPQFLKSLSGICGGKDLPKDVLERLYLESEG